jgi:diguanylate cyclase (GGDEF)-like protein
MCHLIINNRESEQNRYLSTATILLVLYTLGYVFETTAKDFDSAFVGLITEYLSYPFIMPLVFLYAAAHVRKKIKIPFKIAIFIIPLAQSVLAITSRSHSLYYKSIEYIPPPPIASLRVEGSIFYYVCFVYLCAMLIASSVLLVQSAVKQKGEKRYVESAIAFAFLIPVITTMLYVAGLTPWNYDLTPVFVFLTCIIIIFCTIRYNYLHFLPLVTSQIVNEMRDAFVVLDAEGGSISSNIAAKNLFSFLNTMRFGDEIPEECKKYFRTYGSEFEFSKAKDGQDNFYKASVGFIKKREKIVCITFVYYNITGTKKVIKELNRKASYDALTGVYNRGTLMRSLDVVIEKTHKKNISAAVLMMDIDHFKNVNDTYGHQCGDETLIELTRRVSGRLRKNDVFGRYGGEEFCAVISGADRDIAFKIAENVRKIIESEPFEFEGVSFPVTVSIGLSVINPADSKTAQEIIAEADSALYKAKNTGRNKCVIA